MGISPDGAGHARLGVWVGGWACWAWVCVGGKVGGFCRARARVGCAAAAAGAGEGFGVRGQTEAEAGFGGGAPAALDCEGDLAGSR